MATVILCDRCMKIAKNHHHIEVRTSLGITLPLTGMDLCPKCYEEFKEFRDAFKPLEVSRDE